MLKQILMVGLGGFVGSVSRFGVSLYFVSRLDIKPYLPLATLSVNFIGALLLGFLAACGLKGHWYGLAAVGFCGGFTTFSTFSLEVFRMFQAGNAAGAVLYAAASVLLGLAGVWGGMHLFRLVC